MASYCDTESDGISEEIELLQAIYVHELDFQGPEERPTVVNLFLHPSTGNDDHSSKYVCLNLSLSILDEYPFCCPGISIKNPRGLSDAHVTSIQENLSALAEEKIGSPMLYDLIEYAKECLSDNNIPSCPCAICLEHFQREEKFLKTECYHYFHSVCLRSYVDHFLSENENKKIVCPMCRLEIQYKKSGEENDNCSPTEETFVYKPDKEQREAQAERQKIFEYQKQKGGVINIEEEKIKYLIGIKDGAERVGESNDVQPDRVNETSQQESLDTKELLLGNEKKDSSYSENLTYKNCDLGTDKEERNDNRKVGEANKKSSRINDADRKYNDANNEISEPVDTENEYKNDPLESGKNSEIERKSPQPLTGHETESRVKKYSRIVDEQVSGKGNFRNSSPRDNRRRNFRNSKEKRKDQFWEKKTEPRNSGMATKDSRVNFRENGRGRQEKSEVVESLKQDNAKEGHSFPKERKDKYQANEIKSLTTPSDPSKQSGTVKLSRESKNNARSAGDFSTSKQIGRKQPSQLNKKQNQKRTTTPRRTQEDSKDCKQNDDKNAQRPYSSVSALTNQHVQRTKKRDSPVLENFEKSKSSKNFSRTECKSSSNSDDKVSTIKSMNNEGLHGTKHSRRRPPPGFESVKHDESIDENVQDEQVVVSRQSFGAASDSDVKTNKSSIRRPPPGFENVKPNNKKL